MTNQPSEQPGARFVRSPFAAEKTWKLVNEMVIPAKNFMGLVTSPKHSAFRMKGLAMEDYWIVWLAGQGMVQVWVEDNPSGIRVAARALPPAAPESRRAMGRLRATSLVIMGFIPVLAGGLLAYAWAQQPAAQALLILGPLAILAGLWLQLSWKSQPRAADSVLARLGAALAIEVEGHGVGATKLQQHRLDVMRRLKEEKLRRPHLP